MGTKDAIISILSAGAGAIILEILRFFRRKKEAQDIDARQIRKELWVEITRLSDRVDAMAKELDGWKAKYYELYEENLRLELTCDRLQAEMNDLRETVALPQT